jgi:selenocysteine-specific elongation factor
VLPGADARVQLVLERPIAAAVGDRFVVRDTSAQRTIGGGRFLDLRAPARKRRTPERQAQLEALAIADAENAIVALLNRTPRYLDLGTFARDWALAASHIEAIIERHRMVCLGAFVLLPNAWTQFKRNLTATLNAFHTDNPDLPGIGRERLRLQLDPRLPASAFAVALVDLARAGELKLDGAWVRAPSHEVRLTAQDAMAWANIEPLLGDGARFRPPRVRDLAEILTIPEVQVRRLLKLVGRMGKVDEVAHDHFFLRATLSEMVDIAVELANNAANGQFTAAQFRDRLDNGRKVAIQILEFLDRHGVTLRRGDLRRLNKHRLDLFRNPSSESADDAMARSRGDAKRLQLR